jgi:hypothetical protein
MSYVKIHKATAPAKAAASRILGILAISFASAGIAHAAQGLTRAQVQAELLAAERSGDIVEPWTQMKLNRLYPSEYPANAAQTGNQQSANQITSEPTASDRADVLGEYVAFKNQTGDQANSAVAAAKGMGEHGQSAD